MAHRIRIKLKSFDHTLVDKSAEKIVKTVGTQMVSMEKYQGAAASLSAGFALLASSLWGLPVSTTHTKSAAIMGSGASKNMRGSTGASPRTWS